jgi:hypothetical protein
MNKQPESIVPITDPDATINRLYNDHSNSIVFDRPLYKHTPFAFDVEHKTFNRSPRFDDTVFTEINDYTGDIIQSITLKITLPEVHIPKTPLSEYLTHTITDYNLTLTADEMITTYTNLITSFRGFMSSAMIYWRTIKSIIDANNTNYDNVIAQINTYEAALDTTHATYEQYDEFQSQNVGETAISFNFSILSYIKNNFTSYSNSVYNKAQTSLYKTAVLSYLNNFITYKKLHLKFLISQRDKFQTHKDRYTSSYYNFAWVSNIGLAIIKRISVTLGNQTINYHTNTSLDVYYKRNTHIGDNDVIINNLHGNISSLTAYNTDLKPQYDVYVTIPIGTLIPSLLTKHQDLIVTVEFNELNKCCFCDYDEIESLVELQSGELIVEYVHLSETERRAYYNDPVPVEAIVRRNNITTYTDIIYKNNICPIDVSDLAYDMYWLIQKDYNVTTLKMWNDYDNQHFYTYNATISKGETSPYMNKLVVQITDKTIVNHTRFLNGQCLIYHSNYYNNSYKITATFSSSFVLDSTNFIYPDTVKVRLLKQNPEIIEKTSLLINNHPHTPLTHNVFYRDLYNREINRYSFSLHPNLPMLSGGLNMAVIKSKALYLELNDEIVNEIDANSGDTFTITMNVLTYDLLTNHKGSLSLLFSL